MLRSSIGVEEVLESESAPTLADTFTDQFDAVVAILETGSPTRSCGFQVSYHYFVYNVSLVLVALVLGCRPGRLNVVRNGLLYLSPDDKLRNVILASLKVGSDKLWSNDTMYKHLSFLVDALASRAVCLCFLMSSGILLLTATVRRHRHFQIDRCSSASEHDCPPSLRESSPRYPLKAVADGHKFRDG